MKFSIAWLALAALISIVSGELKEQLSAIENGVQSQDDAKNVWNTLAGDSKGKGNSTQSIKKKGSSESDSSSSSSSESKGKDSSESDSSSSSSSESKGKDSSESDSSSSSSSESKGKDSSESESSSSSSESKESDSNESDSSSSESEENRPSRPPSTVSPSRPPSPTPTERPSTTSPPGGECDVVCRSGDHYLPNPADCGSFYQCSNGRPILIPCPESLVFNPNLNVCDYPSNAPPCEPSTCSRVMLHYLVKTTWHSEPARNKLKIG